VVGRRLGVKTLLDRTQFSFMAHKCDLAHNNHLKFSLSRTQK
jgi:hypothetical protein